MKKYLKLIIVGGALLFGLLLFATMAGTALKITFFGMTGTASTYYLINDGYGLAVTCLVFIIIGVLMMLFLLVTDYLKVFNTFNKFIGLAASLLFFVTMILFFCFASGDYSSCSLGAGSVFSAIFCLFITGALAFYGVLGILNKDR